MNEQKMLAQPELQVREPVRLVPTEQPLLEAATEKVSAVQKLEAIPSHKLGKVTGKYSAIEPEPLDPRLAETFSGGRYTAVILERDTVLRRAGVEGHH